MAVHHVARSDDVCVGFGLAHCGSCQQLKRGIVGDVETRIGAFARLDHYSAMAVAGVFAEANVGDEDELLRLQTA